MLVITPNEYQKRRKILKKNLEEHDLDYFIVSSMDSIYYFTGATYKPLERPFLILFGREDPIFIVPKLEEKHMEKAGIGDVRTYWEYPSPPSTSLESVLSTVLEKVEQVGVEPTLPLEIQQSIKQSTRAGISVLPLVEEMRLVKSDAELDMIRQASDYITEGIEMMFDAAYYGISVLEMFSLARSLQKKKIQSGDFDPLQTDFLTACWPAPFSSQPHGVPPLEGRMRSGPNVAMSFGKVDGYAAECERTFFLKPPTPKEVEIFNDMLEARKIAFDMIEPGVSCSEIDSKVKEFLVSKGYEEFLLHRTGHGFGLGNHEGPWVAEGSSDILEKNMLISVEPGIYMPEIGGFRHSDTVLVTQNGYEILTDFPDDLESMTIIRKAFFKKIKGAIIRNVVNMGPNPFDN